ncbi:sugar nucleotide-binding protein [Phytomonospora sp. NPDC050363]|uniref:sugar nucleotide-binding protein n=1 Tax=Phytomonospora sp. NPDC050363 TaxID=3155642 RepID=UPI0033E222A9
MVHLLVTGASGYVGGAVARCALHAGHRVTGTYHRSPGDIPGVAWSRLDIRDRAAVAALVAGAGVEAVVHTAVSADLDDWASIADGAANVAVAAASNGLRLVHLSSDAVFSGRRAPYDESALPEPVNRYGAAKAAAETVVRAVDPSAVVARTSLVLGDGGSKHERFSLDLARGRAEGVLFADEVRSAVHPHDLAAALLELAVGDFAGVIHLGGADALDRHTIGCLIAVGEGLDPAEVPAGKGSEAGVPRAPDTTLNSGLAARTLHTRLRGAREFLGE